MKKKVSKKGLLLIAHGSPLAGANRDFTALAKKVGGKLKGVRVQPAFLDCARPTITEGLEMLITKQCSTITVIPHFLSRGKHATRDIKNLVEQTAQKFPEISFRLTEPVGVLPAMVNLITTVYRQN